MEQRYSDMIIQLATGISQRRMYFDSHPRVVATSAEVAAGLASLIADMGAQTFDFGVFNSKFVRDGRYLVGPSIAGRALIEFAERLGCGGFAFGLPLTPELLTAFFRLAASRPEKPAGLAEAQALLDAAGLARIRLLPPLHEDGAPDGEGEGEGRGGGGGAGDETPRDAGGGDTLTAEFAPLLQVYQAMYDAVSSNTIAVHESGAIDVDDARQSGVRLVELSDRCALDVMQFMRYPDYDSYTIGHSVRVAALAAMLGRALGWPPEVLATLATAGLLHDLGKGRIPDEILYKPGSLDADERRVIESHPALGARILLDHGRVDPVVIAATWGHHIRHDQGGYPDMPGWYRPGAAAEVVHVCDVFEALTAHRPYKLPLPPRKAYEIMLRDGAAFHPAILSRFISVMGLYPPGCEVRLSDGSTAVVVSRGAEPDRPAVRVIFDPHGLPVPRDHQHMIDLHEQRGVTVVDLVALDAPGGNPVEQLLSGI